MTYLACFLLFVYSTCWLGARQQARTTMYLTFWPLVGLLLGSFVVTQVLVVWLQRKRLQRIERKSMELCLEAAKAGAESQRVPITLVTGFLGSGKTTLVNRILSSPEHGLRILVIENELGAISIDHELIDTARQQHMPEGVIVLKNGCMCCSGDAPGSELERVLDKLLELSQIEGGSLPFECVLIETTGLADPSPILQVLSRREMDGSRFYLDAVVALVDSKHTLRHLQPSGPFGFARRRAEAEKQIGVADRVILNKMDLVSGEELSAVRAAVRLINTTAALIPARNADVPLSKHVLDASLCRPVCTSVCMQPLPNVYVLCTLTLLQVKSSDFMPSRRHAGFPASPPSTHHWDRHTPQGSHACACTQRRPYRFSGCRRGFRSSSAARQTTCSG